MYTILICFCNYTLNLVIWAHLRCWQNWVKKKRKKATYCNQYIYKYQFWKTLRCGLHSVQLSYKCMNSTVLHADVDLGGHSCSCVHIWPLMQNTVKLHLLEHDTEGEKKTNWSLCKTHTTKKIVASLWLQQLFFTLHLLYLSTACHPVVLCQRTNMQNKMSCWKCQRPLPMCKNQGCFFLQSQISPCYGQKHTGRTQN